MKLTKSLFVILMPFLLTLSSCKKADKIEKPAEEETEKFFKVNRSADPAEKILVDYLKRRNKKTSFVNLTVSKIGYPVWNKAIRIENKASNTTKGKTETYLIPFVRESQDYVNAAMAVRISGSDTSFRYYCDWEYSRQKNFGIATQYAVSFMVMNRKVFGHERFAITDPRLFRTNGKTAMYVTFPKTTSQKVTEGEMQSVEVCETVSVYVVDCKYVGNPSCTPNCDRCSECAGMQDVQFCWTWYFSDGGGGDTGGDPGGDPGGGGGGGGGGDTPPDCETPQARGVQVEDCEPGWDPEDPVPATDANGFYYERFEELSHYLATNSTALFPCDQLTIFKTLLPFYNELYQFKSDQAVKDKITQLINNPALTFTPTNLFIQEIEDARSNVVNADYFPLKITSFPVVGGFQLSPAGFLEFFRKNINQFITDPAITVRFNPYQNHGIDETALWNSSSPLSAIISIKLGISLAGINSSDDGSVIVSNYTNASGPLHHHFTFTTIKTPQDKLHPVSGHRRFGVFESGSQHVFYIGGFDRISTDANKFGNWIFGNPGFESSDALWRHIIGNLNTFINGNGGSSAYFGQPDMAVRPNYAVIKSYLKKEITLQQMIEYLDC